MLKHVEIFQHFSKNFTQLKIFLVPRQFFLFFYLASKELVFLRKTNYSSCSEWLKYYFKMLALKLSEALLYRSGGVRNYFLCKAPIYLPIEDIKLFAQNGWSVQTWEPWHIYQTKYYWKIGNACRYQKKTKNWEEMMKTNKNSFHGRYWKPQITNLGRIQEYEKFVFDRS